MAQPPDPNAPGSPPPESEEPGDATADWVRPSQRRGSSPTAPDPPSPTEPVAVTDSTRASSPTRRRRPTRDRRPRRFAVGAVALALVLAVVGGFLLTSGGGSSKAAPPPPSTTTTTTAPPATPPTGLIATTKVPTLSVFDQPSPTSKVVTTLSATTDYGLPRTLLATGVQTGWLHVLLPIRPNGSSGWVRATDVTTTTTDYQMQIVLSTHHLTLVKAGSPMLETAVVIGKAQTPTPTGRFYVTDPVDLQTNPNGAYGAFAIGLSGFSNVLMSFSGGPGQIAVHGTPYPDQVGQDLSNGCVRVPNTVILQIAKLVPLGTPVTITA
jgi:lipoprotein-anchoring transpeptidase ErfK/SrfK